MKPAFGITVIALLLGNLGIGVRNYMDSPKIAYVRSSDLVYGYIGMKEAQNRFREKTQSRQMNLDTLQEDYRKALGSFNAEYSMLDEAQKQERQAYMAKLENNLRAYAAAVEDKRRQEDGQMTEGVLNQINSFVEQYGKENGYDIILGTTLAGNLLYGEEAIDITDKVLAALNQSYRGGGNVE